MKGNFHVQFGIGGGEGDFIADHTESWNRKIVLLGYFPSASDLEKLFRRGGGLSQGTMIALGNGFWEREVIGAVDIDMVVTQWS